MNFQSFKDKFEKIEVSENKNYVGKQPVVSVCIQTYQQVNYIAQCLDGILKQKTNFSIEILLGDDDSKDGTREISIEYAKRYPEKIRLFLHHRENNIKINGTSTGRFNLLYNLYQSNGNYIALCEGDDYWTDPYKLQKQIDFLEANPDYGLVHTNYKKVNEKNDVIDTVSLKMEPNYYDNLTLEKLLYGNLIATCTVCFRKKYISKISGEFLNFKMGDYPLWLEIANESKIKYLNEVCSSYRISEQGVSNSINKKKQFEFYKGIVEIVEHYVVKFQITEKESLQVLKTHYLRMMKNGTSFKNKLMQEFGYQKLRQLNKNEIDKYHYILYLGGHFGLWNSSKILGKLLRKIYIIK